MNTKIILAMMAIFLLSGCTGDDANDAPIPNQEKSEIRFDINSQKYTRANIIGSDTELQGQALRIDAYYHGTTTSCLSNTKLLYDSDRWRFDDGSGTEVHYYWPIEGSVTSTSITVGSLDFVGYCPNDLADTSVGLISYSVGHLSFSCTGLPMTSDGQSTLKEFMCAYTANRNQAGGTVGMTFYHPFSYVKFQLAASHPDIHINSITLKNLKTGGNCTFDGTATTSTWSSLTPAGTVDFVATINRNYNSNPAIPQQIGQNYIMVPQTFAGDIVVKATWTDWGENIEHTVSTKLSSADWQPGKSYIYTFTIRETDLIVNTEKFTEQW